LVKTDKSTGKKRVGADNVHFINGSSIRALSASKEANIEGWTGNLIILDESQGISDITFYKKIMPMAAATAGQIIQIGTPRSRNHFYQSYLDTKNWKTLEFDWKHGTAKYKKTVKAQKTIMPREDFNTEYNLKWMEAESMYFTNTEIDNGQEEYDIPVFTQAPTFMGMDIAKERDKSIIVVVAFDGLNLRVVDLVEVSGSYPEQRDLALSFISRYKPRKVLVDATGIGNVFLDFLHKDFDSFSFGSIIEGYVMSGKAKATELYPNLKLLFSAQRIKIPMHTQMDIELRELRKHVTTSGNIMIHHPPRGHDDYPDALALACLAARPFGRTVGEPMVIQVLDDGSTRNIAMKKYDEKEESVRGCLFDGNDLEDASGKKLEKF
jgi:phage FluMu gp28-like protein